MARLRRTVSDQVWPVPAHALIGRSPACYLQLDFEHASKEHAVIKWTAGQWSIKDLGSRNGTFVDGRRLEPGDAHALVVGQRVAFGRTEDPWVLEDDDAPVAMAMHLSTRDVRESEGGLLALPTDATPEVVVLQRPSGDWAVEDTSDGDDPVIVSDRQTVDVAGEAWCLLLPDAQEATPLLPAALSIEAVSFRFGVSLDEEHVTLTLVAPNHEAVLQAREFNYVLLTLARARLEERDKPIAERGWIDREVLLKMLRMRPTALNVAIHRARQRLLEVGLVGAAGIVEVRRRARRFGSDRIEIGPLADDGGGGING